MTALCSFPSGLSALADDYDALLCDIWGVVHNGERLYPGVAAALSAFRAQGGSVLLVSNVPRPRAPIFGQLDRLGLPRSAYDGIVTSGDATRTELAARAPGPVLLIGPPMDDALWTDLGLVQADGVAEAAFLAISGLNDPLREVPTDYLPMLRQAKTRELTLVCANPDIVVRVGDDLIWCAGAVAREYEKIGGKVVMAGKPHPPIYSLALAELDRLRSAPLKRQRALCVGDGLGTDVLGANQAGLDALFIASGVHGENLLTGGGMDDAKVAAALTEAGVMARYAMPALVWD